jgi:hypothetical protein
MTSNRLLYAAAALSIALGLAAMVLVLMLD